MHWLLRIARWNREIEMSIGLHSRNCLHRANERYGDIESAVDLVIGIGAGVVLGLAVWALVWSML